MLDDKDLAFMRRARLEIRGKRESEITISGNVLTGKHPVTGEPIYKEVTETVNAIVTVISVRTQVERYVHDGIEIRSGDIIVDISRKDVPEGFTDESTDTVIYNGIEYAVVSGYMLGMGGYNRLELLGRRSK